MDRIPSSCEPLLFEESAFIDSEFIELINDEFIDVKMMYPILGMQNAEEKCYIRKEVYERLIEATKQLPAGYKFRILDAWRPFALQHELFVKYSNHIIKTFGLTTATDAERLACVKKFVSEPIANSEIPPVHTTGGAIDLTIIDPMGKALEMGTEFDEFSEKAYTSYYENSSNEVVKKNRRLLYFSMIEAGFTNLPSEWWHYDYGDRFWSFYNKKPALYRGVFTRGDIINGLE